jgi:hypothetical protein
MTETAAVADEKTYESYERSPDELYAKKSTRGILDEEDC